MTLIEMLLAVTLLGIIMVPLALAIYIALGTNAGTIQRTTDTAGGQLLSSYFISDVQSSDTVQDTGFTCALMGGSAMRIVELGSADAASGATTAVSYDVVDVQVGISFDYELIRSVYAVNSGTCSLTESSVLLRSTFGAADPQYAIVACSPSPCGPGARQVTLTVTPPATAATSKTSYSDYALQLTGTRRVAS
jgi:hypothetical protein